MIFLSFYTKPQTSPRLAGAQGTQRNHEVLPHFLSVEHCAFVLWRQNKYTAFILLLVLWEQRRADPRAKWLLTNF
jgi:hypothetical protein